VLGLPYNILAGGIYLMTNTLSSGLEDYIEAIYISSINNENLKGADLARKLSVSRASVSEALAKLVSKGLIKYNSYEAISLTKQGKSEAQRVYSKHHILKEFFEDVLNVSSQEAGDNACKIEHIISENILSRMEKFSKFFRKHKKILEIYIEESEK
jgi:DtxR family Mn-dependent transcriptional regulator